MNRSGIILVLSVIIMILAGSCYYPKWQKSGTEATISWDIAGYYMYLPALFIYEDIKGCGFADSIIQKYQPSPWFDQAFKHESGNYVMKYSAGMAVQYLPFFAIAHAWALADETYEADGYSRPYQFMIYLGCLLITVMGLFFLRKILLKYFNDTAVAWTLGLIVLGTNYLEYASITNAMTHGVLFGWYSLLIWLSIKMQEKPGKALAVGIGLICGLIALTRPTEIISVLIPLLWGASLFTKSGLRDRFNFWKQHFGLLLIIGLCSILVGSIQLIYWKYASGDWLVYSYQDQGFSWLKPHIRQGLFSYNNGWLPYSPVMIFALIGFIPFIRKYKSIRFVPVLYISLFIYIAFAWDIWWYGGSLGQRTMVQIYPLLAFPLAAFLQYLGKTRWLKYPIYMLMILLSSVSLWWTHQAHKGGMFLTEQMTWRYYWAVLGTFTPDLENQKLLDTKDFFRGVPKNLRTIYENNFETEALPGNCQLPPIEGLQSICLNKDNQNSPAFNIPIQPGEAEWLRMSAMVQCGQKEWTHWRMTQFIVRFFNDEKEIKGRMIRLHRLLHDGQLREIFQDVRVPQEPFTRAEITFWNADGDKEIRIDNLKVETFDE